MLNSKHLISSCSVCKSYLYNNSSIFIQFKRRGIHQGKHHPQQSLSSVFEKSFETENIKVFKSPTKDNNNSSNITDKSILSLLSSTARGVYILELCTPKNLNAMTEKMGQDIQSAVKQLQQDTALRSLVITGNGRAFSAGGDLKFLNDRVKTSPPENIIAMRNFYSRFLSIRDIPVPTIAAINGHAVGAGLCFALACDIRLVSDSAKLGLNFSRIGIPPGMAGSFYLPKLVGPQAAAKLIYTGDLIDAQEAVKIGLAIQTSPDTSQLLVDALSMASRITTASPIAIRTAVKTLRSRLDEGLDLALQREADSQAVVYTAPDLPEGLLSKQEKREPIYPDVQA